MTLNADYEDLERPDMSPGTIQYLPVLIRSDMYMFIHGPEFDIGLPVTLDEYFKCPTCGDNDQTAGYIAPNASGDSTTGYIVRCADCFTEDAQL